VIAKKSRAVFAARFLSSPKPRASAHAPDGTVLSRCRRGRVSCLSFWERGAGKAPFFKKGFPRILYQNL